MESVSAFIPDEKITEIRESSSIIDVISSYISLKKAGVNYKGLCPFHHEKTPSFVVNESKKIFHCFGCGAGGNVFTFLMKCENVSFLEAVRLLAKRQGIALPEKQLTPLQKKKLYEREELFSVNEIAADFYHDILLNDQIAKKARAYLEQRGISAQIIREYRLGFALQAWDSLVKHLQAKKVSLPNAQKVGLIITRDTGGYYDRFRGRIIFPILNIARHVIGFGGRVLDNGEPKYLNSPESLIYNKSQNLYGLPVAAKYIRENDQAILVEGYFDLLMLHHSGCKHAVASLGTALTEHQIQILNRYTRNIITVFDADASGEKAMLRSLPVFLANSLSPRLILLPADYDPDSYLRRYGEKNFHSLIAKASPLLDFVLQKSIQQYQLDSPQGKISACEAVARILEKITNPMERDLYVEKMAQKLGIKEVHLLTRMGAIPVQGTQISDRRRLPAPGQTQAQAGLKRSLPAEENAERLILELMVFHPEIIALVEQQCFLKEFSVPAYREVGLLLCRIYNQHGKIDIPHLLNIVQEESLRTIITESFLKDAFNDYGTNPTRILRDCIQKIRSKKLQQEMTRINSLLKKAETVKDEAACLKLQLDWQKLMEERKKIQQFTISTPEA